MTLEELFTITKGKRPPELFEQPAPGLIPFLRIDALRNESDHKYCADAPNLVLCERNDVVIVWDGANCGLASSGIEGAIGSTLARLRPRSTQVFGPYAG